MIVKKIKETWTKIEHKMFSFISINRKGKPLKSLQFIIQLVSMTKTKKGLEIKTEVDKKKYKIGKEITDKQMKLLNIEKCDFHGDWNYKINPIIFKFVQFILARALTIKNASI